MLNKFVKCQWENENRSDWTKQVKKDLSDLDIPLDWSFMKSHSKNSFKQYMRRKAREVAFST